MDISFLKNKPEHLDEVAELLFNQWGRSITGNRLEDTRAKLAGFLNDDGIPLNVICLKGTELAGTYNLLPNDLPIRADLAPWFGSLYVKPEHRGQGVGSALVRHAIALARSLRYTRLYLITSDKQALYTRLGFSAIDNVEHRGETVTVMGIEL
jgi:GNAT superfamily N-acetyltransferase